MNDGLGVITGEKGDAIYLSFSGPVRLTADPNVFNQETTFTITGGKGRYLGATGSGAMSMENNRSRREPPRPRTAGRPRLH